MQEDMIKFCRPKTFDLIVNLGTSLGYFEDPKDDLQAADEQVGMQFRRVGVTLVVNWMAAGKVHPDGLTR